MLQLEVSGTMRPCVSAIGLHTSAYRITPNASLEVALRVAHLVHGALMCSTYYAPK